MMKTSLLFAALLTFIAFGTQHVKACSSDFTYSVSGNKVSFTADSSNGSSVKFTWQFGDGTTSHDRSPSHTFASGGTYNVCFYVADSPCEHHKCVSITVADPTYCLGGQVLAGIHAAYPGKVVLYQYNPHDSTWSAVDTTSITYDSTHGVAKYLFSSVKKGVYIVKAILDSSSTYYKRFMPTYYGNSIHWGDAKKIEISTACKDGNNIKLHEDGTHSGKGSVSGHVHNNHKKQGPDEGIMVQLLDAKDSIVEWANTDNTGYFNFTNLANGTYKVYGEFTGLPTYPAFATISDGAGKADVIIYIYQNEVTTTASVNNATVLRNISMYPNPASGLLNFDINTESQSRLTAAISDISGKCIQTANYSLQTGTNHFSIDISSLKGGMYIISLTDKNGQVYHARMVKN